MKFFLVNTVSKRRTKMARKAAPTSQKYVQHLCGGLIALRRGKHFPITYAQLERYRDELEAKQKVGAVEVREGSPVGPIVQFAKLDRLKPVEDVPVEELVEVKDEAPAEELVEVKDEAPVTEEQDDAPEDAAGDEVEDSEEGDPKTEGASDFASMTNKELVAVILEHSDDWPEKELKKLKKSDLLELMS